MASVFSALLGAAYGCGYSYYIMRSTAIVPPSRISTTMSIVMAFIGLGAFLATYLVSSLQAVLRLKIDETMGFAPVTPVMPILAILSLVGGILSIILTIRNKKYPSEYTRPCDDSKA
jgi:phosphate/sulfate permease